MKGNGRINVLLVEDDPAEVSALKDRLPGDRFAVMHAVDLANARRALDTGVFDVALLDLYLCDQEGLTTLRDFRLISNGLPTIVLTGTNKELLEDGLYETALEMGAVDCLAKDDVTDVAVRRAIRREALRSMTRAEDSATTLRVVKETADKQMATEPVFNSLDEHRRRANGG